MPPSTDELHAQNRVSIGSGPEQSFFLPGLTPSLRDIFARLAVQSAGPEAAHDVLGSLFEGLTWTRKVFYFSSNFIPLNCGPSENPYFSVYNASLFDIKYASNNKGHL